MSQVSAKARVGYAEIMEDIPVRVQIPGTSRTVKVRGIKPYTIERLTKLWIERDIQVEIPDDSSETLKSMCKAPYFSIKEAVLMTLNSFWSIRLFYPFKWRIWAYLREYTEEQMMPIIRESKKKLPLTAHWMNMAFSVDMRNDWKKMTQKEAEQYRAELLSVVNQLSLKNSQNMGEQDGE